MVQEYGRYFGMKTACFRGGCLTGPGHSGAELHGFLSYLVKCARHRHARTPCSATRASRSATTSTRSISVSAFWHFFKAPRPGEVYNMGGGRASQLLDARSDRDRRADHRPAAGLDLLRHSRAGDHIWWVSDVRKFSSHYPGWRLTYTLERTIEEIHGEVASASRIADR